MTDATSPRRDADSPAFRRLIEFIEEEIEFASSYYDDAYLDRRISGRMRRTGVEGYDEYRRLLAEDPDERAALLEFLSVNVTGFFRNPEVWEELRGVLAALAERRRRVEAWSAPCSDGREPYSLAMLALDEGLADAVRIRASDIDEEALATAREGVYETTRTTDIGEELAPLSGHAAYVDREGDRFAVTDPVRSLVEFDRHDLIRGPTRGPFDLVLCRNLLIYVDAAYKQPVFETITGSLRSGGYLVIGKTETLPASFRERFTPVEKTQRIYRMD